MDASIFETNYENYLSQLSKLDFSSIKETLGLEIRGQEAIIPFYGENYTVSSAGITNSNGERPDYLICVVLSKYLLLCPGAPIENKEWSTLKDFHKTSQFTNVNVFTSDAEKPIVANYSGRLDKLSEAARKLGGIPSEFGATYDLAMQFKALPKIDILLLFNDSDEDFPATCSILYQKQAEDYLDPESLIMVGIAFTRKLKNLAD